MWLDWSCNNLDSLLKDLLQPGSEQIWLDFPFGLQISKYLFRLNRLENDFLHQTFGHSVGVLGFKMSPFLQVFWCLDLQLRCLNSLLQLFCKHFHKYFLLAITISFVAILSYFFIWTEIMQNKTSFKFTPLQSLFNFLIKY